jgi:hypothetical protein
VVLGNIGHDLEDVDHSESPRKQVGRSGLFVNVLSEYASNERSERFIGGGASEALVFI